MAGMKGRIEGTPDEVSAEVVRRLDSGEGLDSTAKALALGVVDLIAAVARAGLGGEGAEGPGLVRSSPARPRLEKALSDGSLASLLPGPSRPPRLALAAGLLQVLDNWDASHHAAQEADDLGETASAAYWHMIAHRREPDAGNAHYWSRRVGRPAFLGPLADDARPLLEAQGDRSLADRLIVDRAWSPPALIDLATRTRPGSPQATLARALQRLEMIHLLGATIEALGLTA